MLQVVVRSQADVERARREARLLARSLGFGPRHMEEVTLATSELATNLVRYARQGRILLNGIQDDERGRGIQIESQDRGPGIADLGQALEDGFTSGTGLGGGLPAVQRLMDEFAIDSGPHGTRIVARKWNPR